MHDSSKYLILCSDEMSLSSLGKKKKKKTIFPGGSFAPCQFVAIFQSSLLESHECVQKKIQTGLKSNHFRQSIYLLRATNTKEGCNANRNGAPNSQLCSINSVSSTFTRILQKNSLINSGSYFFDLKQQIVPLLFTSSQRHWHFPICLGLSSISSLFFLLQSVIALSVLICNLCSSLGHVSTSGKNFCM